MARLRIRMRRSRMSHFGGSCGGRTISTGNGAPHRPQNLPPIARGVSHRGQQVGRLRGIRRRLAPPRQEDGDQDDHDHRRPRDLGEPAFESRHRAVPPRNRMDVGPAGHSVLVSLLVTIGPTAILAIVAMIVWDAADKRAPGDSLVSAAIPPEEIAFITSIR